MWTQGRRYICANLAILVLFLGVTLLINFAHTEKTPRGSQDCPACHFQNSSLATQAMPCLFLPSIAFIQIVEAAAATEYWYLSLIHI